eukprot:tig00021339_g20404.t1
MYPHPRGRGFGGPRGRGRGRGGGGYTGYDGSGGYEPADTNGDDASNAQQPQGAQQQPMQPRRILLSRPPQGQPADPSLSPTPARFQGGAARQGTSPLFQRVAERSPRLSPSGANEEREPPATPPGPAHGTLKILQAPSGDAARAAGAAAAAAALQQSQQQTQQPHPQAATATAAATGPAWAEPPRKFVNEHFECLAESAMRGLGEGTDFTVVGIVGRQGVGKSRIANELFGATPQWSAAGRASGPFPVGTSAEAVYDLRPETVGVDLHVSPEGLLLLDTQPLWSAPALCELLLRGDGGGGQGQGQSQGGGGSGGPGGGSGGPGSVPADCQGPENWIELQAIQQLLFLLSACHVVLVVSDSLADLELWRAVRACAETLKHRIPDPSLPLPAAGVGANPSSADGYTPPAAGPAASPAPPSAPLESEYLADVVFVFNKLPDDSFEGPAARAACAALDAFFAASPFRRPGAGIRPLCGDGSEGFKAGDGRGDGSDGRGDGCGDGRHVQCFFLPWDEANLQGAPEAYPGSGPVQPAPWQGYRRSCRELMEELRDSILAAHAARGAAARDPPPAPGPEGPAFRAPPSFARPLSERDWVRGAGRLFDAIRRSPLLAEYNKVLQRLGTFR